MPVREDEVIQARRLTPAELGENLGYLVRERTGRPVAALLSGSAKIHGPCCSHRRPEKGPRIYFHTALTPVVVAPG